MLTKEDLKGIKEVVAEALESSFPRLFEKSFTPFAAAIQNDFREVKTTLAGMDARLCGVEADVKWMKENSSELFTKLDEFITLYRSHEEKDKVLAKQLARLEARVAQLETQLKSK